MRPLPYHYHWIWKRNEWNPQGSYPSLHSWPFPMQPLFHLLAGRHLSIGSPWFLGRSPYPTMLCISTYPFSSLLLVLLPLWDGLESQVGSKTRRQTCRDLGYANVSWCSLMSQVQVPWNAQSCAKCHPSNISNPQADPQQKKFWDTSLTNQTIKIPVCVTIHQLPRALPACKRASVIISSTALPIWSD